MNMINAQLSEPHLYNSINFDGEKINDNSGMTALANQITNLCDITCLLIITQKILIKFYPLKANSVDFGLSQLQ